MRKLGKRSVIRERDVPRLVSRLISRLVRIKGIWEICNLHFSQIPTNPARTFRMFQILARKTSIRISQLDKNYGTPCSSARITPCVLCTCHVQFRHKKNGLRMRWEAEIADIIMAGGQRVRPRPPLRPLPAVLLLRPLLVGLVLFGRVSASPTPSVGEKGSYQIIIEMK